jgi:hypothetical protein
VEAVIEYEDRRSVSGSPGIGLTCAKAICGKQQAASVKARRARRMSVIGAAEWPPAEKPQRIGLNGAA